MPHALFLGSSLASVDRLDMVPRSPKAPSANRRRSRARISSFLRFGRNEKVSEQDPEGEYEMDPVDIHRVHTLTGLNEEAVRPPVTGSSAGMVERATEVETEQEVKHLSDTRPSEDDEEDGRRDDFMRAMKRYEAKLGAFNRIRWVDLHLKHATVGFFCSRRFDLQPWDSA